MRSFAGATAIAVALALASCGSSADAAHRSGIKGRVLDGTCLGPCAPETTTRPYAGEASVVIIRLPSERRVAAAETTDGRFRKRLDPGRYRVAVRIDDPCWSSTPLDVRVRREHFKRVRPVVVNECIR